MHVRVQNHHPNMRVVLLYLALAASTAKGTCPPCSFTSAAGTYNEECVRDTTIVTCISGQIGIAGPDGSAAKVDRAMCVGGSWFGSSCSGAMYDLGTNPNLDCGKSTNPQLPEGCACSYTDDGAARNNPAPYSTCANNVNHVLECDKDIYVPLDARSWYVFDRVECSSGVWTGIDSISQKTKFPPGMPINVSCGVVAEPTFPSLLPNRGGLQFVGIVGGFQRYECPRNLMIKLKITTWGYYAHAKYVECNADSCRISSSNGVNQGVGVVADVSCRDYGTMDSKCSIPYGDSVWIKDGTYTCEKAGTYPHIISYFDESNTLQSVSETTPGIQLHSATCGPYGWGIAGTTIQSVQLASFWCWSTPDKISPCAKLNLAPYNVDYDAKNKAYVCRAGEIMKVITPDGVEITRDHLECDSSAAEWRFIGTGSTEVIPAGSSVSCTTETNLFPPSINTLVYDDVLPNGLTRWKCIDSTIAVDIEFHPEEGKKMPVHAAYIESNSTFYRISSSVDGGFRQDADFKKINAISCVDMGVHHAACSVPWDIGGIRTGNKYECMKGFFLHTVYYVDETGSASEFIASSTDSKALTCNKDGWQLQGTSLFGLKVTGVHCWDANQWTADVPCKNLDVQFAVYKLKKQFTCYEGETIGYTLNGTKTLGSGKTLYCGTNAATGAWEWQWSNLSDPSNQAIAIPEGATMSCF